MQNAYVIYIKTCNRYNKYTNMTFNEVQIGVYRGIIRENISIYT